MEQALLILYLFAWAGLCGAAVRPTRRGAHPKAAPRGPGGMLLDQHGAGDYRVDDAAYIDDYPDELRDYDYQVTPERKPGDSEGDDYPEGEEEKGVVPPRSAAPATPHARETVPTRKPKRYQNGTLYDDYVAQCAGLMSDATRRMRAQPVYPHLVAVVLAMAYLL